jgi:hypothetical protein
MRSVGPEASQVDAGPSYRTRIVLHQPPEASHPLPFRVVQTWKTARRKNKASHSLAQTKH